MIMRLSLLPSFPFFIIWLLISNLLFLRRMPRRENFAFLFPLSCLLLVLGSWALRELFPNGPVGISFIGALLLSSVMAYISFDISVGLCLFCANAGYITQHIASLVRIFSCYLPNPGLPEEPFAIAVQILAEVLTVLLIDGIWGCRMWEKRDFSIASWVQMLLMLAVVLSEVVFYSEINSSLVFVGQDTAYLCFVAMNVIMGICVLSLQFNLLLKVQLESELDIVKSMLYKEKQQFHMSRESVELINRRCHDMKHQIHTIGKNISIDPTALKDMENVINIYDSFVQSGNPALDIILAEKSLSCQQNGIVVNSILDGAQLHFMRDTDIYSLFGNLMDNAIQSSIKMEPDMRVIGLTVRREGDLISINSHNYFDGDLKIENGLPATTKADKTLHGYGVKSMAVIVDSYGGTISFQAKDHIFNVNILIPVQEAKTA